MVGKSESWVAAKKKNWRKFRSKKESESEEESSIEDEVREVTEFGSQFSYNFDFRKTIWSTRLGSQSTTRRFEDTATENPDSSSVKPENPRSELIENTGTSISSRVVNLKSDYPNTTNIVTAIEICENVDVIKEKMSINSDSLDTIPNFRSSDNLVQPKESSDDSKLVKSRHLSVAKFRQVEIHRERTLKINNSISSDIINELDEKSDEKCTTKMNKGSNSSTVIDQNLSLSASNQNAHSIADTVSTYRVDPLDKKFDEKCITPMKNVSKKLPNTVKKLSTKSSKSPTKNVKSKRRSPSKKETPEIMKILKRMKQKKKENDEKKSIVVKNDEKSKVTVEKENMKVDDLKVFFENKISHENINVNQIDDISLGARPKLRPKVTPPSQVSHSDNENVNLFMKKENAFELMKMNSERMNNSGDKVMKSDKKLKKKYPKKKLGENLTKITTYFETAPSKDHKLSGKNRIESVKVEPKLNGKEVSEGSDLIKNKEIDDQILMSAKNLIKIGPDLTILEQSPKSSDPPVPVPMSSRESIVESCQTIRSVYPLVRLPNPNPTTPKRVAEVTKFFGNLSSNGGKEVKIKCHSPVLQSLREKSSKFLRENPGESKSILKKNDNLKRKRVGSED